MINRNIIRAVSLLLIPCLVADPVTASAFSAGSGTLHFSAPIVPASRFQQEALATTPLTHHERHPILLLGVPILSSLLLLTTPMTTHAQRLPTATLAQAVERARHLGGQELSNQSDKDIVLRIASLFGNLDGWLSDVDGQDRLRIWKARLGGLKGSAFAWAFLSRRCHNEWPWLWSFGRPKEFIRETLCRAAEETRPHCRQSKQVHTLFYYSGVYYSGV